MTTSTHQIRAQALAVCAALTDLVRAGPAWDAIRKSQAALLLRQLRSIPGLGQLMSAQFRSLPLGFDVHFSYGVHGMSREAQRVLLLSEMQLLQFRIEEDLLDIATAAPFEEVARTGTPG
jgi:hypothetical protein